MTECNAQSILGCCLSDLKDIKDFNNLINVINFYHFNRCHENSCRYCSFVRGLNIICLELEKKNEDVRHLKFYCIMRKELFIATRVYIHKVAEIEK